MRLQEIGDGFEHNGVEAGHDQGTEQHAADVAHAADDDDAQRDDRDLKIIVAGLAAGAEIARPQRAGQTALRRAECKGEQFHFHRVDARAGGGEFIFPDRNPRAANPGSVQIPVEQDNEREKRQKQVIPRLIVLLPERVAE